MRALIFLAVIFSLGCQMPCVCKCNNCGMECRNICTEKNCIPGNPCCDKCTCGKKPSIKVHD